jgi:hypothetical protein
MHLWNPKRNIRHGTLSTLLCDVRTVKEEIDKGTVEKYTELHTGERKLSCRLVLSF